MLFIHASGTMRPRSVRTRRDSRRRPSHNSRARPLALEALEDRCLLAVTLTPNLASPALVGDTITWTATATGMGATPVYQFSVGADGGPSHVVRDFSAANTFTWSPLQEGTYDFSVTVKNAFSATDATSVSVTYEADSRAAGTDAVITPTANPLVALYSAPPTLAGATHVNFRPADDPNAPWVSTDTKVAVPGLSTNFLVAGMLPNTTYEIVAVTRNNASSPLPFTTGSLPAGLTFPRYTVVQPPGDGADLSQNLVFHMGAGMGTASVSVLATDLTGNVEWYYDPRGSGIMSAFATSLVPGGTVLMLNGIFGNVLREVDLAGDTLRETNVNALNAQLAARGLNPIANISHDAQRLPDGSTAVLAQTTRTVMINGAPRQYQGDMVIVLDENFQIAWTWDAFDFLDVNRGPIDTDTSRDPVDWTHANAVNWSPADGNLIVSLRNQDWVIKIDYANGAGDGHVIWRLGQGGDFTIDSSDPYPWFSHQHNAHYVNGTTLVLFDNGTTRGDETGQFDSRGQAFTLDEQSLTATPVLNAYLGNYSPVYGSGEQLPNGNFVFTSGSQGQPAVSQSIEVLPDGTQGYVLESSSPEYRTFRTMTLYEGTALPPKVRGVVVNDGSAQRSRVTSLTVTFSAVVHLDPGAFELVRREGGVVRLRVAEAVVGGHTVATITFAGAGIIGGSLADGHYTLIIRGGHIRDDFGQALDGAGTGMEGSERTDKFFRLFGDGNGDGRVDFQDVLALLGTLGKRAGDPGYLAYFDYYGDGRVGLADLLQLLLRLGR
jgi:hypothetical protein